MAFSIVMGVPDMDDYWNSLEEKNENGTLTKDEAKTYKLLHNTFKKIKSNPKYPGLNTHEIDELTARYGFKVFQSYCENHNPKAMRVYWVYGPEKSVITILAVEPHPNDAKSNAYKKIKLSKTGDIEK